MQKTLIEMHIQLSNVLSDLSGVSGMAIVQAILAGKRDPQELAALADPRVKASQEVIAKSLDGNWREELLFVLRQEVDLYRECQKRMAAGGRQLRPQLQRIGSRVDVCAKPIGPRPKGKRARGTAPQAFDLRSEPYRLTGVDWTPVDGMDVPVAPIVISEVGTDLKAFPGEKHFANWLGLCPTNETSGGKVLKRRTPKVVNRAKVAFPQAASTLIKSQRYLGAPYRRLRTPRGAPQAMTAMARKLACLFIGYSPGARNMWTAEPNTTKLVTRNSRSACLSNEHNAWVCRCLRQRAPQHDYPPSGFWKGSTRRQECLRHERRIE